jgi:hypothetical protein
MNRVNTGLAVLAGVLLGGVGVLTLSPLRAAGPFAITDSVERTAGSHAGVPALSPLAAAPGSPLQSVVERYSADEAALGRRYDALYSPARGKRLREFYSAWRTRLEEMSFDSLPQEGKIDYVLLDHRLKYELYQLDRQQKLFDEMLPLIPFAPAIIELQDAHRRMETVEPRAAATRLTELIPAIEKARRAAEELAPAGKTLPAPKRVIALRAASTLDRLRGTLDRWHRSRAGYDPMFTWWAADPYKKADDALKAHSRFLRERLVGQREGQDEPIIGDPIGAEGLKADLAVEMIPYSLDELIAVAEREFAWCETEMRKAAKDMGYDDWRQALEKVKGMHVEPGRQPELIRDLAREAADFVEKRDLVTVPPMAREIWRAEMMTADAQKVSPFFTGGEVIRIAFPTDAMAHEDKLMSLRGNNVPFSHATVQHELIPGHGLQAFMTERYNTHRSAFWTPFWVEGWALYWEMLLWDEGFARTPEERVGMLFWRSHRAARIIFSLRFHQGKMSPQEAIDFLVERVGHERANATAEVRRSFNGTYPPLYQAAYMLGGLQLRALHKDLVGSGKLTNRQYHDAILQGSYMPIEMVRARLTNAPLQRDSATSWRFAGEPTRKNSR